MRRYFTLLLIIQGTTYVVTEFGIFVCSSCSGIHREMSHKGVKGIGMSNFTDKETELLATQGNEVKLVNVLIVSVGCLQRFDGRL